MIAVRIGPDIRFVVVAAPRSLEGRKLPRKPQDLVDFNCINLRLPTHGGLYAWELAKGGREVKVRVDGRLVLNNLTQILEAALFGLGLAYLPEDMVAQHVAKGRLATVLDDWCQPFAGYHLCYPSRRHQTPAFAAVADVLRYRR
jgi:DNA-binding transcriptional LysR family regulator